MVLLGASLGSYQTLPEAHSGILGVRKDLCQLRKAGNQKSRVPWPRIASRATLSRLCR